MLLASARGVGARNDRVRPVCCCILRSVGTFESWVAEVAIPSTQGTVAAFLGGGLPRQEELSTGGKKIRSLDTGGVGRADVGTMWVR